LAGHVITVLWVLPGSATVEGGAAGLAMNIQRFWIYGTKRINWTEICHCSSVQFNCFAQTVLRANELAIHSSSYRNVF